MTAAAPSMSGETLTMPRNYRAVADRHDLCW
jgi:hypothetical protein